MASARSVTELWSYIREIIGDLEFSEIPQLPADELRDRPPHASCIHYPELTRDDVKSNRVMVCELGEDWRFFALTKAGATGVVSIGYGGRLYACRHGSARYSGSYTTSRFCLHNSLKDSENIRNYLAARSSTAVCRPYQRFMRYLHKKNASRAKRMLAWMTKAHVQCRSGSGDEARNTHTLFYALEPYSVLSIVAEYL